MQKVFSKDGHVTAFTFIDSKAKKCVLGFDDGSIKIINSDNSETILELKVHDRPIASICVVEALNNSSKLNSKGQA